MKRTYFAWALAALSASAAVTCLLAVPGCSGSNAPPTSSTTDQTSKGPEEPSKVLDRVRHKTLETLARGTEASICRTALQDLNSGLGGLATLKEKDQRDGKDASKFKNVPLPQPLSEEARQWLADKKHTGLSPEELTEIEGTRFTRLDGQYLDGCFLLRDAARSLDVDDRPVLERAVAAFGWVMRQVRLEERGGVLVPASFALRNGWGGARERDFVFLALLRQLDCEACVVEFSDKDKKPYFVCGVLVDDTTRKQVYLFDAGLGLPLPGPEGHGIATLDSIRKQGHLLAAFDLPESYHYEPRTARIQLVCDLTALAPRTKYLQAHILAPDVAVNLAQDAQGLEQRFRVAVKELGEQAPEVEFLQGGAGILRQYLPSEEGGVARPLQFPLGRLPGLAAPTEDNKLLTIPMWRWHEMEVPWEAFPASLRDLPYKSEAGWNVRMYYVTQFAYFSTLPNSPHDQLLRGQFDEAMTTLVKRHEEFFNLKARLDARPDLTQAVAGWSQRVDEAYTTLLRAQNSAAADVETARANLNRLMKEGEKNWIELLDGTATEQRGEEAVYLAALCAHEQAERLQERVRRAGDSANEKDRNEAREKWRLANDWWSRFLDAAPHSAKAPTARLLAARARLALGDSAQALKLLEDSSGDLNELEKAARAYEAKQLKK